MFIENPNELLYVVVTFVPHLTAHSSCPFLLAGNTVFQKYKYLFFSSRSVSRGMKFYFLLQTHLIFTFSIIFNSFLFPLANLWFYLFVWGVDFPCFSQLWLPHNVPFHLYISRSSSAHFWVPVKALQCDQVLLVHVNADSAKQRINPHRFYNSASSPFWMWHSRWEGDSV